MMHVRLSAEVNLVPFEDWAVVRLERAIERASRPVATWRICYDEPQQVQTPRHSAVPRMRSTFLQTLLTAGSVVAVAQQQRHQEVEENILSARQAFREIHDHLLGLRLPGEVSQLKVGEHDQGLLEISSRVNTTGWTELVREEDESTGIRKGNVKEDPEDRPRGKFQPI
jgi:hypothetical protein